MSRSISLFLTNIAGASVSWLIPFTIILLLLVGFYQFVKRKYKTNKAETIQALFVLILVVFIVLTLTSIIFRGEGMALVLPWN